MLSHFLRTSSLLLMSTALSAGTLSSAAEPAVSSRARDSNTIPAYEQLSALPLPELKASLERAGWPATLVQALLSAEIQHRFSPPFDPRPSDLRSFEFWRTGPDALPFPPSISQARVEEQQRRDAAAREAYDALFPVDTPAFESPALAAWNDQRQWGTLSAEKRQAVSDRRAREDRERDALFQPRGGMLAHDEWLLAWKIVEDARADLVRLLTADELLDFDLRNSVTAEQMRSELDNFQPTRDEFLAIFKLRHAVELAFRHKPPGVDSEVDRRRADAAIELDKQLATLLGPSRYADYTLSLQPACQTLQFDGRYARAEPATIRALYRSLLATKEKMAALDTLPPPEKSTRAAALKATLYSDFRQVLDEEATRRYLQEQLLWP